MFLGFFRMLAFHLFDLFYGIIRIYPEEAFKEPIQNQGFHSDTLKAVAILVHRKSSSRCLDT